MYLQFFGLNEAPFSITPDPAFVFLSAAHRDALAHLLYGVGQGGAGGFVQLTGEVGTGKTTLCRCLLEQVPEDTQVALILNPLMTPRELLATLCEELGLDTKDIKDSNKDLVDTLNRYLLEQHAEGRRVVVIIDEAQNLSPEALEQVRLLTNLETAKDKLLQMVLLGQPELRALLQRQSLRQLSQRITARYHLAPLGPDETHAYVRHRMKVAGARENPFRRSALRALYQRSAGVPRLINIIADRTLAGAYAQESGRIGARLVNAAADEVQPNESRVRNNWSGWAIATVSTAALLVVTLGLWGLPYFTGKSPLSDSVASSDTESQQAEPEITPPPIPVEEPASAQVAAAVGGVQQQVPEMARPENVSPAIDESWLDSQHAGAWKAMAELWRAPASADDIESACDGSQGRGYACLHDFGSWSRVQQLGLPVLLVLQDEETRYLLLRGLTDQGLLVGNEDSSIEVSREAIESRWLGEFIVAWPQAPDWPAQIQRGESGAAVDIIMEMAGLAKPPWRGEAVFGLGFESWLMAFQRRHGLESDGIIGPNTLLYLMAPTISQPRLILASEESS